MVHESFIEILHSPQSELLGGRKNKIMEFSSKAQDRSPPTLNEKEQAGAELCQAQTSLS